MTDNYAEKISELETRKQKLIKQREKINVNLKKVEAKIKDYEDIVKIQSFDSTVTVLREHGMSIDDLVKKVAAGEIK